MDGKTEKCPQCGGHAQGLAVMCGPANGAADDEMKCQMAIQACEFCGGLGIVEAQVAERYRRGDAIRRLRVKSGLTHYACGLIPMTIPWSELTDSLSDILIEDAIDRAADKGVKVSRAALEQAAKARAAELVDREMFPTTRKIVQQLTVSIIEGRHWRAGCERLF